MMDIEAIVKKFAGGLLGVTYRSAENVLRAALTELAAEYEAVAQVTKMNSDRLLRKANERIRQLSETHAIEMRAYEATVQNQAERIRRLEAERVPEGIAQRPYAWAWEQHAWVVTAQGKHRGIRKSMDVCQPPIQTQESYDFIRMFPLYEHTTVQVPEGWKLAPVIATDRMVAVGMTECHDLDACDVSILWTAMAAAAPAKEGE